MSSLPRETIVPPAGHVSIQVVKQVGRAPRRELIVRVVRRLAYSKRQTGPGIGTGARRPPSVIVVSPGCINPALLGTWNTNPLAIFASKTHARARRRLGTRISYFKVAFSPRCACCYDFIEGFLAFCQRHW